MEQKYENLPVYKATYDLLIDVTTISIGMTREYRYTVAEKLKNTITDLLTLIYEACTYADEREVKLKEARRQLAITKLHIRVLHDLKQIGVKRFSGLCEKTDNLTTQLINWHKSTQKKSAEKNPESL